MIYTLLRTTKRIIKQCIGFSYPNNTLNIYKTLLFNILCFGLKDGLKFPILIYGPIKLCIIGTIKIHTPIRKGLVTIGKESFKTYNPSKFLNSGIIEIYGPVTIAGGCIIENYGTIVCKGYNRISDNCMILIREKLTIGEQTSIGFHSHIMDSDDHFTINVLTGDIHKNTAPILLGNYNWFGNRTFIKKGVVTPDYLIVASPNALLTKNYSEIPPYSIVGGAPIKLIKTGFRRIYNNNIELLLKTNFKNSNTTIINIANITNEKDLNNICQNIPLK